MFQIVLLVMAGRSFYRLAEKHNRAKWLIALAGVGTYFAGAFLGAMLVAVIMEIVSPGMLDDLSDQVLGLIGVPIGAFTCWGCYKFLENKWTSKPIQAESNILDNNLNL